MIQDVRLGMPVFSRDGERLGRVERIVVDPDSQELLELVVHRGYIFGHDQLVDRAAIHGVDANGVHLHLSRQEADNLPPFAESQYVVANVRDMGSMPWAVGAGPSINQPILWRASAVGMSTHAASEAEYLAAVASAVPVEVRSDLPEGSVVIDEGTDVVDCDGEKVGVVADVRYDDNGALAGFSMRRGLLRQEELEVPISAVAAITHRAVRLKISAAELQPAVA